MQDMNSIYEKYIEIVYKYVFCLTGNKDTAEEKTNNEQIEMCFKAYKDEKWQTQFD